MSRIVVFMAMLLAMLGCKAVPDEDTLGELREQVAAFPIEIHDAMARWAANRVAYGYLLHHRVGPYIGHISCSEIGKRNSETEIEVQVADMLKCLDAHLTTSYKGCLSIILDDVSDEHFTTHSDCRWKSFYHATNPERMPPETDAGRVTVDTITEALLGPPPPKEIQLILLGIGMLGRGGILCVQGADWACVEDPFGADAPTTSAGTSGGDR